jgi:hypothetical protein
MKFSGISQKSDWVGILSSAGCILHCLAMPVVVYASGAALHGEHTEWLDYLFVAVAAGAVVYSVRQAHSLAVKLLLIGAWLLFFGGRGAATRFCVGLRAYVRRFGGPHCRPRH